MSADGDRLFCNPAGAYLIGYVQSALQESAAGKDCVLALPDPVAAGCLGTWECDIPLGQWQFSPSLLELPTEPSAEAGTSHRPAFARFVHREDYDSFLDALQLSRRSNVLRTIEHRLPERDGETRTAITYILASRSEGKATKLMGVLFDAELRRKHGAMTRLQSGISPAEDLSVSGQRFIERLAGSLPESIWVSDLAEQTFTYRNRDPLGQLGYPLESERTRPIQIADIVHPNDLDEFELRRKKIRMSDDDDIVEVRCRLRTIDGEWRWFQIRSVVFRRGPGGEPIQMIGMMHDITLNLSHEFQLKEMVRQLKVAEVQLRERQEQLEELNRQLAGLATTDGLTSIYNYRAFHEKLEEEVRRARRYDYPLSIVVADLDDFKAFNDRYGHPAGDERLRQFASLLESDSRDSDFVARTGGEEFAVILINTGAHDAVRFVNRIIDHLAEAQGSSKITASFGCVQLESEDRTKDDLVRRADECLYKAKRQGKNRVVVVGSQPRSKANA